MDLGGSRSDLRGGLHGGLGLAGAAGEAAASHPALCRAWDDD